MDEDKTEDQYQHRGTDDNSNPDDNLTEQEAVEQGENQGYSFEDFYTLVNINTFQPVDDTQYKTMDEALAAGKERDDRDQLTVSQNRRTIPPVEAVADNE